MFQSTNQHNMNISLIVKVRNTLQYCPVNLLKTVEASYCVVTAYHILVDFLRTLRKASPSRIQYRRLDDVNRQNMNKQRFH